MTKTFFAALVALALGSACWAQCPNGICRVVQPQAFVPQPPYYQPTIPAYGWAPAPQPYYPPLPVISYQPGYPQVIRIGNELYYRPLSDPNAAFHRIHPWPTTSR